MMSLAYFWAVYAVLGAATMVALLYVGMRSGNLPDRLRSGDSTSGEVLIGMLDAFVFWPVTWLELFKLYDDHDGPWRG